MDLPQFSFEAWADDATNLTGTRYFDFGGLSMPGTWVSAGIVITVK